MSLIYPDLRDRERTCIKEKVKSRYKYTCSEFPCNPVKMTAIGHIGVQTGVPVNKIYHKQVRGTDRCVDADIEVLEI